MVHKKGSDYGINNSICHVCLINWGKLEIVSVNRPEFWESQMTEENSLQSKIIQKYVFVSKIVFAVSFWVFLGLVSYNQNIYSSFLHYLQ